MSRRRAAARRRTRTRFEGRWLHQLPDRAEIEIQLFGRDVELLREIQDGFLQAHQRKADRLGLRVRQRSRLHPPDRLTLEQLPNQLHQRQHELQHRLPHVVRIGVPPRRARGSDLLDLLPDRLDLFGFRGFDRPPRSRLPASRLPLSASRLAPRASLHRISGANANGGHGPLMMNVAVEWCTPEATVAYRTDEARSTR